ncbi:MAG TPA: hypothetical protein VGK67_35185 [Myxococcales bacterium]
MTSPASALRGPHLPLALGLLLAGSSCSPGNFALPEGAALTCESDADCPTPSTCNALVHRCVRAGENTPPAVLLETVKISPSGPIAAGVQVTISFQTSVPLVVTPELRLASAGAGPSAFALVKAVSAKSFEFQRTATGAEPEETVSILATLIDEYGNTAVDLAIGTVRFDFTLPRLVSYSPTSHSSLKAAAGFDLALTTSEALKAPPTVQWKDGPAIPCTSAGTENGYACPYLTAGAETEGPAAIQVSMTDPAGNAATRLLEGLADFDFQAPSIEESALTPPTAKVRPGTPVTLVLRTNEPIGRQPAAALVRVGPGSPAKLDWTAGTLADRNAAFSLVPQDGQDGTYDIVLSGLEDRAGNLAGDASGTLKLGTLVIDGAAPQLAGPITVTPANGVAADGATATVSFALDKEAAQASVALRVGQVEVPFALSGALPSKTLSFSHAVVAADPEGAGAFSIRFADALGNSNSVIAPPAFGIDRTAPKLSIAVFPAGRPARAGETLSVAVDSNEPLDAAGVVLTGIDSSFTRTVTGTSYVYSKLVDSGTTTYTVVANAHDPAGNAATPVGATLEVTAQTDADAPVPTSITLVPDTATCPTFGPFKQGCATVGVTFDCEELSMVQVTLGARQMTCDPPAASSPRYHCSYAVGSADGEGTETLVFDLMDLAGNVSRTVGPAVQLDAAAPQLAGATLQRSPSFAPAVDAARELLYTSVLDPYTNVPVTIQLLVYASEPLSSAPLPVVSARGASTSASLPFSAATVSGNTVEFSFQMDPLQPPPADRYSLSVAWSDAMGNSTSLPLAPALVVVRGAPDPLLLNFDLVQYQRVPWGSKDTGGQPRFSVVARAGAVDPAAASAETLTALAYRDEALVAGNQIGSAPVASDGSFTLPDLSGGDLAAVWLALVDRAGAKSPAMDVKEVLWTATMGGKIATQDWANPNVYDTRGVLGPLETADDAMLAEHGEEGLNQVGDAPFLTADGAGFWTDRTYRGGLPPLDGPAMAYDSGRGRLVLFGGELGSASAATAFSPDTWEWDGASWAKVATSGPRPRRNASMAYDSARGVSVLFGGRVNPGDDCGESAAGTEMSCSWTWEWDGARWMVASRGGPPSRELAAMAYDPVRARVVLFGGYRYGDCGDGDASPSVCSRTWEWDGSQWTVAGERPSIAAPEEVYPTGRSETAMAYDATSGAMILFGGEVRDLAARCREPAVYSGMQCHYTWGWKAWGTPTCADAEHPCWKKLADGSVGPGGRNGPQLAYNAATGRVLMAGGYDAYGSNCNEGSGSYCGSSWEWNGSTSAWAQTCTTAPCTTSMPVARRYHAMAFDPTLKRVVLAAGSNDSVSCGEGATPAGFCIDTWTFGSNDWQRLSPSVPDARSQHAMAYDSVRKRWVLFGGVAAGNVTDCGEGAGGYCAYTWEWTGQSWLLRSTGATGPKPRFGHAMAYDSYRQRVVMFGGFNQTATCGEGDATGWCYYTWEWDGTSWTQKATTGPHSRYSHAMAFDPATTRRYTLLFGGTHDRTPIGGCAETGTENECGHTWGWKVWGTPTCADTVNPCWKQLSPAGTGQPARRSDHEMAYDGATGRQRITLFGGKGTVANCSEDAAEPHCSHTWAWAAWGTPTCVDAATPCWKVISTVGPGVAGQRGRIRHAMAYDDSRKKIVTFGGFSTELKPPFEFDGSTWSAAAAPGAMAREYAAMAYDPDRQKLLLFGGRRTLNTENCLEGRFEYCGHLWELDAGENTRPAQVMQARFGKAVDSLASVQVESVAARLHAGGTGYPSGSAQNGASLFLWDQGKWGSVASNISGATASPPAALSWSTATDAAWTKLTPVAFGERIGRLFGLPDLTVAVAAAPTALNGVGGTLGSVAVDYAEVSVAYRRCPDTTLFSATGAPLYLGTTAGRGNYREASCGGHTGAEQTFLWTVPAITKPTTYTFTVTGSMTPVLAVLDETCTGPELACSTTGTDTASVSLSFGPADASRHLVLLVDGAGSTGGAFKITGTSP